MKKSHPFIIDDRAEKIMKSGNEDDATLNVKHYLFIFVFAFILAASFSLWVNAQDKVVFIVPSTIESCNAVAGN